MYTDAAVRSSIGALISSVPDTAQRASPSLTNLTEKA